MPAVKSAAKPAGTAKDTKTHAKAAAASIPSVAKAAPKAATAPPATPKPVTKHAAKAAPVTHKASEKAVKATKATKAAPVTQANKTTEAVKPAKTTKAAKASPVVRKTRAPARPAGRLGTATAPHKRVSDGYGKDERFLASQRTALLRERSTYLEQAASLKAEAESLVEEMEPGDIQFDDESGEGGTVTVDRERDLALSAQALAAVEEIDHTLAKMDNGTYGICENCGRLIPKARLEALPYARLCIDCKSGGLSRR
jgi:DnaK suppressor protein